MEAEAQFIHYQLKEAMPSLMKEGQQNDGRALYALGQIFLTQGIYTGDTRTLLRSMAAFSKGKEDSEEKGPLPQRLLHHGSGRTFPHRENGR